MIAWNWVRLAALFWLYLYSIGNNGTPYELSAGTRWECATFLPLLSVHSLLYNTHPDLALQLAVFPLMIKRMAGRFGSHLGHHKSFEQIPEQIVPPSPSSAQSISASLLSQYDHRGSISTQRTSASEWSKRGDSMDIAETENLERVVRQPRGMYRLSDFIIQRTLGTGSFGRVHLGMQFVPCTLCSMLTSVT